MSTSTEIIIGDLKFQGGDVIAADVYEAFDPTNLTLQISTATIKLYNENEDFNIINPTSEFQGFRENQPVTIWQVVNGKRIYIGLYYVEKWESLSERVIEFELFDQIGLLDKTDYRGGLWLTATPIKTILESITAVSGIKFEIAPELEDIELTGWIPFCTCREALHQVAFAAGVFVVAPRMPGFVRIGTADENTAKNINYGARAGVPAAGQSRNWQRRWRAADWEFSRARAEIPQESIIDSINVEQVEAVKGLELVSHLYTTSAEVIDLFEDSLAEGIYTIRFDQPIHSHSVTGAVALAEHVNYITFEVESAGTVTITGKGYVDNTQLHTCGAGSKNIVRVDKVTMLSSARADAIKNALMLKLERNLKQKSRLLSENMLIGDRVAIQSYFRQLISGYIESASINLAGGFISAVEILGRLLTTNTIRRTGISSTGASRLRQRMFRTYASTDGWPAGKWWYGAQAAWRAKGATDANAALVDLTGNANNLTYDNYDSDEWSADNGWAGNGADYFDTGILPALEQTIYLAFVGVASPVNNNSPIGARESISGTFRNHLMRIYVSATDDHRCAFMGTADGVTPRVESGVLAMNKAGFWLNGVKFSAQNITDDYTFTITVFLMAINEAGSAANIMSDGSVAAACIVNSTEHDNIVKYRSNELLKLIS